jgi:hypothetical protein
LLNFVNYQENIFTISRKPCTIEWRYTAEGELVRVSTRSGRIIPKSPAWEETYDYAKKTTYKR